MNIEDLRKLKEEIEQSKGKRKFNSNKKYVELDGISKWDIESALECTIKASEIIEEENTDKVIKDIENFMEEIVKYLSINNVPYDQICIRSSFSVFCEEDFVNLLHNNSHKENEFNTLIKDLPNKIFTNYIPLSLRINFTDTGTKEIQVDDYIINNTKLDNDYFLEDTEIYGNINFDKFILILSNLGYTIEFSNGECKSFNDYINNFINSEDRNLYIKADFGRKKDIQKSKGIKK